MLKNKVKRAREVIESDRIGLVDGSKEIIRRDVERLLGEYFVLNRPIKMTVSGEEDKIHVVIDADCASAKRFNLIK